MARRLTIDLECIDTPVGYVMAIELKTDKAVGLPTIEGTLENGLATRFHSAIQDLIEIAKQGGLK